MSSISAMAGDSRCTRGFRGLGMLALALCDAKTGDMSAMQRVAMQLRDV